MVVWLSGAPKRAPGSLVKSIWLKPKEIYYRLALEGANFRQDEIPFDEYYEALKELVDKREKIFYWWIVFFASLLLYHLRVLVDYQLPAIRIQEGSIGYVLLIAYACSALLYANNQTRIARYQALFEAAVDNSFGTKRQHFLLKYPHAYNSMMYHHWISARPKDMHPKSNVPIRMAIALLLMLVFSIAALFFVMWLTISVSIDLWSATPKSLGYWGKVVICAAWAILLFSALLPSLSLRKIHFEHFGLTHLLERFSRKNPERYSYFIRKVGSSKHMQNCRTMDEGTQG